MPRGKKLSIEEKIEAVNSKIATYEKKKNDATLKLKELKKEMKLLQKEQKLETVSAIQESINNSNINPEEILEFINSRKSEQQENQEQQ